jgi:nicotinate-nucleotide adenylyltransferase
MNSFQVPLYERASAVSLKEKSSLLDDHHRLAMLRLAVEDNPRLKDSNIEFGLDKPSYTVNTLAFLREKHPENEFALIMGEDNLRSFHKWKNHEIILANHQILVYPRIISDAEKEEQKASRIKTWLAHPNVHLIHAPAIQISATQIRNAIRDKKDVRYLLSEPVYKYCKEMHFYEK